MKSFKYNTIVSISYKQINFTRKELINTNRRE